MNVLIAVDSFKSTLSSLEASNLIRKAIIDSGNDGDVFLFPLADGGEGSLDAIKPFVGGNFVHVNVTGPDYSDVNAKYLFKDGVAYIESAQVVGIDLNRSKLTILDTTTEGIGMLIAHAINKGAKEIYLFLGGVCTNDAGVGMLNWIGVDFFDKDDKPFFPVGEILKEIERIDATKLDVINDIKFHVISDVTNPLVGPNGATKVFAKQKGANLEEIDQLEEGVLHLVNIIKKQYKEDISNSPCFGAAGGLGFASIYFLNANVHKGSEFITKLSNLESYMDKVDLVITGEGKLDETSFNGKLVSEIVKLSSKHHKKVIAMVGKNTLDQVTYQRYGLNDVVTVNQNENDINKLRKSVKKDLYNTVKKYFSVYK